MNPLNNFFLIFLIIPFIGLLFGIGVKVINSVMTNKNMEV